MKELFHSAAIELLHVIFMYSGSPTNLVFGQLYFTGLQIDADRPAALQLFSGPREPSVQLIQRILKLTQTQQGTLQLMLSATEEQR